MKQYLTHQNAEQRSAYKRELEDNDDLSSAQKEALVEEKMKKLVTQQKADIEYRELMEFRQKVLQDRHSFEKALLQRVRINHWSSSIIDSECLHNVMHFKFISGT